MWFRLQGVIKDPPSQIESSKFMFKFLKSVPMGIFWMSNLMNYGEFDENWVRNIYNIIVAVFLIDVYPTIDNEIVNKSFIKNK